MQAAVSTVNSIGLAAALFTARPGLLDEATSGIVQYFSSDRYRGGAKCHFLDRFYDAAFWHGSGHDEALRIDWITLDPSAEDFAPQIVALYKDGVFPALSRGDTDLDPREAIPRLLNAYTFACVVSEDEPAELAGLGQILGSLDLTLDQKIDAVLALHPQAHRVVCEQYGLTH